MTDVVRYIPWGGLLLALALLIVRRRSRVRAAQRCREQSESTMGPAEVAEELKTFDRARGLFTAPERNSPAPSPGPSIALGGGSMEVRNSEATYLLVALADGRVSLHLRDGPSMHGLGAIPVVQLAAEAFRASIESHGAHFLPEEGDWGPELDWAVIRTRTERGCVAIRLQVESSESDPRAEVLRRGFVLRDAITASAK